MKPRFVKFNLTHTGFHDEIMRRWQAELKRPNPERYRFLRLARNDGSGYDTRPESREWDPPQLSSLSEQQIWTAGRDINLSDRYVRFWNIIARRVKEIDPDAKVAVYAYGAQRHVPLIENHIEDNIVIEYVGGEGL